MVIDGYLIILLFAAGFGSGLFISICSGTAAGYMIPILTIFAGKSIHESIGTSLFVDCIVGLSSGLIFLKKGKTLLKPLIPLIIFSAIGAFIGSFFTSHAPERGLNIYIGIVLLVFGVNLVYNGFQRNVDFVKSKYSFGFFKKYKFIVLILAGLVIGIMSGFTGFSGAGFIAIGLIFIYDYDLHTAIGTSLVVMFFLAGTGTVGHIISNEIIWNAVLIAGIGALIGSFIGSNFANRINEDILGRIIGLIMLVLGVAIFIRLFF